MDGFDELVAEHRFSGVDASTVPGRWCWSERSGSADRAHGVATTVDTRSASPADRRRSPPSRSMRALRARRARPHDDRPLPAGRRPAADRRRRDDRAAALPPVRHRRLPRRGRAGRRQRLRPDVPVHRLATTEGFLPVLAGHPMSSTPGEQFVVLQRRVHGPRPAARAGDGHGRSTTSSTSTSSSPAGMRRTAYLRRDELPGTAALGYLERRRVALQRPAPAGPGQR